MKVNEILSYLKSKGGFVSYTDLYVYFNITPQLKDEVDALINQALAQKWIIRYMPTARTVYFRISNNLLPAFPEDSATPENEHYEITHTAEASSSTPVAWRNPYLSKLVRRNQAGRQTCVGQSAAYGRDLNVLQSGGTPSQAALTDNRYVTETIRGASAIRDTYLMPSSFSSECVYSWSRELGKVSPTVSGSYVSAAVEAMRKRGNTLERDWYSPLYYTGGEVFPTYPMGDDDAKLNALNHTIDGFAAIRDLQTVKDSIYKYGYVLMPINIYSNYSLGKSGPLPDPAGYVIGSHALCFVAFDANRLYFLHSWDGWEFVGSISNEYYEQAAGTAYAVIDAKEAIELAKQYAKVYISSNVVCTYYVNGNKVLQQPAVIDISKEYVISAVPSDTSIQSKSMNVSFTAGNQTVSFEFKKPASKYYLPAWLEERIRSILGR